MIMLQLSRWQSTAGLILLFLAIGFAVFGRALTFGFVSLDDISLLFHHPAMLSFTPWHVLRMFTSYDPELYIPLTLLSFKANELLLSPAPWSYHLVNLLLHIGNALLLARVAWLLLRDRSVAVLAGLLFLVHPLSVETAVWVSGRKDALMAFFFLLSLCWYLQAAERDAGERRRLLLFSLAAFMLGALSKVTIIVLPVLFLLCDVFLRRPLPLRQHAREKGPFFLIAIVFGAVALLGKTEVTAISAPARLLIALEGFFFHAWKIVFPTQLSVFYPYELPPSLAPRFAVLLGGVGAVIAVLIAARRRAPLLFFALAWYVVTLAPSLFNLAKGVDLFLGSDRYAYLPMMGAAMLAAAAGVHLFTRLRGPARVLIPAGAALVLVAFALQSRAQTDTWRDGKTLAEHAIALAPRARIAYLTLGNELRSQGKFAQALSLYDQALAITPDGQAWYHYGLALEMMQRSTEALEAYRKAVELDPAHGAARVNVGKLLHREGKADEAIREFQEAALRDPTLAMAHFNMGVLYWEARDLARAEAAYRRALRQDPLLADARLNLVVLLIETENTNDARRQLAQGLRYTPGDGRLREIEQWLREGERAP